MRYFFLLFLFVLFYPTQTVFAQSTPLIRQLESKRGDLQKQINETESMLKTTKKNVGSQLKALSTLNGQIEERKRFINLMNNDMEEMDKEITSLSRQLTNLELDLKTKKKNYASSVNYLHNNHFIQDRLLFIFSAKNVAQTYRRMRYVQEYATYQRIQGEEILQKQDEIGKKRSEIQSARNAKQELVTQRESEKQKLEVQEKAKKTLLAGLQKKQKNLQSEVSKKKREAQQLNARIDRLINEEIERIRRQAEEEARKKAEAAAKQSGSDKKKENASSNGKSASKSATSTTTTTSHGAYTMSKADLALSSEFSKNRGRLPMPITGPYIITSHYGQYAVQGMKGVQLDNKGIDIQGKPGAQARAIFNGKVVAVFKLGGLFNILIRHGNYISVYCNLSSSSVQSNDNVSTKQVLGTVFSDHTDGDRTVLHFQLRREKEKLNPEPWLNR